MRIIRLVVSRLPSHSIQRLQHVLFPSRSSAEHGAECKLTLHIFNLWNEATSTSAAVFKVIDYYGWLAKLWPLHTFPWLLWTFVPKSEKSLTGITIIMGAFNGNDKLYNECKTWWMFHRFSHTNLVFVFVCLFPVLFDPNRSWQMVDLTKTGSVGGSFRLEDVIPLHSLPDVCSACAITLKTLTVLVSEL